MFIACIRSLLYCSRFVSDPVHRDSRIVWESRCVESLGPCDRDVILMNSAEANQLSDAAFRKAVSKIQLSYIVCFISIRGEMLDLLDDVSVRCSRKKMNTGSPRFTTHFWSFDELWCMSKLSSKMAHVTILRDADVLAEVCICKFRSS